MENIPDKMTDIHFLELIEKQHQLIIENLTDLISLHTPEGIYRYVSPVCEALLGYSNKVLIDQSAEMLCHPEDQEIVKQFYQKLQFQWIIAPINYRIRHQSGHYIWLETNAKVIPNRQTGEIAEILCISREITKPKQVPVIGEKNRQDYRFILDHLPDLITTHNSDGIYHYASCISQDLLGYTPQNLIGKPLEEFCHPEDHRLLKQFYCQLKGQQKIATVTYRFRHAAGHYLWLETTGNMILNTLIEATPEVICVSRDMTKRKQTEEALIQAKKQYRKIFESVDQGLFQLNLEGDFLEINPALAKLYGYEQPQELLSNIKTYPEQIYANAQRKDTLLKILENQGEVINFKSQVYHRNGQLIGIQETIWTVYDQEGKSLYYEGTAQKISNFDQANRSENHFLIQNPSTSLPNREWFHQQLKTAITRSNQQTKNSFAILLINIDNCQLLNESLGEVADNELFVKVAQRIQKTIRTADKLAKLGDDKFALLVENQSLKEVILISERILHKFRCPFELGDNQIFVRSYIGITSSKIEYKKPENVIQDAHLAMYRAKEKNEENYAVFNPPMKTAALTLIQLETDLRQALNNQQLCLHYQPIMELNNGHLSGFEALLRWEHPTKGFISPSQFISIAETAGLINSIGWWVLEKACLQLQTWQQLSSKASQLVMNINVSAQQLKQENWEQKIKQLLETTGIEGTHIKLEITESCLLETVTDEKTRVQALKNLGLGLCIDDFGTGYSSLSRLNEFPIDTLKIDRSFIKKLQTADQSIVSMIISLAHTLKMTVVAEGIETREQLNHLQGLGCELGQGYFFSKPLNEQQATQWVRNFCTMSSVK